MHFSIFLSTNLSVQTKNIVFFLEHRYYLISLLLLSCLSFLAVFVFGRDLTHTLICFPLFFLSLPVALIFFLLLLLFTLSPYLGHGCMLQWTSCMDRLSRGLLENTAKEQKCKQVEHSFIELHSFPCHHILTLNIPLSSACMVCCGFFVGQNFPKAPYCACASLLTINQAFRDAFHPINVVGILWADESLLWIHVTLFFGSQHSQGPTNSHYHTNTLISDCLFTSGLVSLIWPHTVHPSSTFTILIVNTMNNTIKISYCICPTKIFFFSTLKYSIHYLPCYTRYIMFTKHIHWVFVLW